MTDPQSFIWPRRKGKRNEFINSASRSFLCHSNLAAAAAIKSSLAVKLVIYTYYYICIFSVSPWFVFGFINNVVCLALADSFRFLYVLVYIAQMKEEVIMEKISEIRSLYLRLCSICV